MALSDTSKTLISIKKLVGKAHTSNDKDVANESLPSGITVSSNTIFGQSVPSHTGSASQYHVLSNSAGEGVAEFLRLSASFIAGTDTDDGRHGFALKLPDNYESNSKNAKKGTDPFTNGRAIYLTTGSLQLIPPSYDTDYEAKPYHTGSGETQIAVLDSRDWSLDYFNGIFFQQDPPGTGDNTSNPRYVDAYIFVGEYLDKGVFSTGLTGSLTKLTDGTSYLSAGSNITIASASSGQITISSTASGMNTRFKKMFNITSDLSAGTDYTATSVTFSSASYNPSYIDVFVNGQLLRSGTSAGVSANSVDYSLTGNSTLKFSFNLEIDDLLTVIYWDV